jgi:hypothetical protein
MNINMYNIKLIINSLVKVPIHMQLNMGASMIKSMFYFILFFSPFWKHINSCINFYTFDSFDPNHY